MRLADLWMLSLCSDVTPTDHPGWRRAGLNSTPPPASWGWLHTASAPAGRICPICRFELAR